MQKPLSPSPLPSPRRLALTATFLAAALLTGATAARAETERLRVARQPGLSYLPLLVAESERLVEKRAAAAGLPKLEVEWREINGGPALNDALLSDSLDIAAGGISSFAVLWNKSAGQVKGIAALNSAPLLLNTIKADAKSLADLSPQDRIAIPAVKVTTQAIIIQMAAAKAFGMKDYQRYDTLTVALPPAEATVALLSGKGEITAAMSGPPLQSVQLQDPRVHTILNSEEVVGGPFTNNVLWARTKFYDANPKVAKAFFEAIQEADEMIRTDPKKVAAIFGQRERGRATPPEMVESLLQSGQIRYTTTPENVMKIVEFMRSTGLLTAAPPRWQDLFFPMAQPPGGS